MEKQVSKEKIQEILKNNPEFAKTLESQESIRKSTNPVRVFDRFDDAKATLGLMKPLIEKDHEENILLPIPKNSKDLGSGIFGDDLVISYLTGKKSVSIGLDKLVLNQDAFPIDSEITTIKYEHEFHFIRLLIIKKDVSGKFHTITHIENKDLYSCGKHEICINDCGKDSKITPADEPILYIDVSPENKYISFSGKASPNKVIEKFGKDDKEQWYIVPLVLNNETRNSTLQLIENSWDKKHDEFINRLVSGYKEEEVNKIKECIKSNNFIDGNPHFDKGLALFDLDNNFVYPISNAIEANNGSADVLDIVSSLFPKYGDEYISKNSVKIDEESKLPILDKKDIDNLKIVGVDSEFITSLVKIAKNAYTTSANILEKYDDNTRKNIRSKAYDAECRAIIDIENKEWFKAFEDEASAMDEFTVMNADINSSEQNIEDVFQQFASLQITSKRISTKVNNGEFKNMYMQLCNTYFDSFYHKYFPEHSEDTSLNISAFPKLLRLINKDFKDNNEFLTKKIALTCKNTLIVDTNKDKFGNECDNLFEKTASAMNILGDVNSIPDGNIPIDELNKRIADIVFIRYNYIDSLSRTAFKFVSKLYPEILKVASSTFNDTNDNRSKEYIKTLGINTDNKEWQKKVDSIKHGIENARKEVERLIETNAFTNGKKANDLYAIALGGNKAKNKYKAAEIIGRYAVIANNTSYFNAIVEGLGILSDPSKEELNDSNYVIEDSGTRKPITLSEYNTLNSEQKKNFSVYKKLSRSEIVDVATDYLLRLMFTSTFMLEFIRIARKYADKVDDIVKNDAHKRSEKVDSEQMFVAELSMMVPSISVIETAEIKDDGSIDLESVVPSSMKVKLGTNAVEDVLNGLDKKENLIASRNVYITECLDFVNQVIKTLDVDVK